MSLDAFTTSQFFDEYRNMARKQHDDMTKLIVQWRKQCVTDIKKYAKLQIDIVDRNFELFYNTIDEGREKFKEKREKHKTRAAIQKLAVQYDAMQRKLVLLKYASKSMNWIELISTSNEDSKVNVMNTVLTTGHEQCVTRTEHGNKIAAIQCHSSIDETLSTNDGNDIE
jgi:hypothetical protein